MHRIFASVLLAIAILSITACGGNIDFVKDGKMEFDTTRTLGDALHVTHPAGTWSEEKKEGRQLVKFSYDETPESCKGIEKAIQAQVKFESSWVNTTAMSEVQVAVRSVKCEIHFAVVDGESFKVVGGHKKMDCDINVKGVAKDTALLKDIRLTDEQVIEILRKDLYPK